MKLKKTILLISVLLLLLLLAAFNMPASQDQITIANGPTQTPYVIYVVITATPEPQTDTEISIVNDNKTTVSEAAKSDSNQKTASAVEKSIEDVPVENDQCSVALDDGSSCTMGLEVISEPTYGSGAKVAYGEVFYKEWLVKNTGTCTWTPDYQFVFEDGWQIGNTKFGLKKNVEPGDEVLVKLGMTALLAEGKKYHSTYVLTSPTGVKCGEITSQYAVERYTYFQPTAEPPARPGPYRPGRPDYEWNPWGGPPRSDPWGR